MKKKLNKKLTLNKKTISNLEQSEMENVVGGIGKTKVLCLSWPRCSEHNPNGCTNTCEGVLCITK